MQVNINISKSGFMYRQVEFSEFINYLYMIKYCMNEVVFLCKTTLFHFFYSIMKFFQNNVLLSYKGYYIFWLQFKRLKECEKMLVAVEMAGWLNEANLALQAVVQCYGLLAPLIFYKIPSVAGIQVFFIC